MEKNCKICGCPFPVGRYNGAKKFCSDECRRSYRNEYVKRAGRIWYQKHKKELGRKPKNTACKRCGGAFLGKFGQQYCPNCLKSGDWYMTKLREQRRDEV